MAIATGAAKSGKSLGWKFQSSSPGLGSRREGQKKKVCSSPPPQTGEIFYVMNQSKGPRFFYFLLINREVLVLDERELILDWWKLFSGA